MADFFARAFGQIFREKLLYVQHEDLGLETHSEMVDVFLKNFVVDSNFADPFFIENSFQERNSNSNFGILRSVRNERINCVKIYSTPLDIGIIPAEVGFHAYVVFQSVDFYRNSNKWWSLEKNDDYIVLRQSTNEEQVTNTFYSVEDGTIDERTTPVKLLIASDKGQGSLKDLLSALYTASQLNERYDLIMSNCQKFASFIFEKTNGEGIIWSEPMGSNRILAALYHYAKISWNYMKQKLFRQIPSYEIEIDPYAALKRHSVNSDVIDKVILEIKKGKPVIQECDLQNYRRESINKNDAQGYTLLEWAEAFSREDLQNFLTEEIGAVKSESHQTNVFLIALQYLNSEDELNDPKLSFDGIGTLPIDTNVNQTDDTILHLALYGRKWKIAEKILSEHADYNINAVNSLGHTPLHSTIQKKSCPDGTIEALLNRMDRENINKADGKGYTPLHWAIYVRSLKKIELLLKKGAIVNQPINDRQGLTPLQLAVQRWTAPFYATAVFKLLSEIKDFDIESRDKRGNTALHTALSVLSVTFTQLVLDHGADVNITNDNGLTPLELAIQWPHCPENILEEIRRRTTNNN